MKLTQREIGDCGKTLMVLLDLNIGVEPAVKMAMIEPDITRLIKAFDKGINQIAVKYSKLAEQRKNMLRPLGNNTTEEQENKETELEEFKNKPLTIDLAFPSVPFEKLKSFTGDETLNFYAKDLAHCVKLGITKFPKEKEE